MSCLQKQMKMSKGSIPAFYLYMIRYSVKLRCISTYIYDKIETENKRCNKGLASNMFDELNEIVLNDIEQITIPLKGNR